MATELRHITRINDTQANGRSSLDPHQIMIESGGATDADNLLTWKDGESPANYFTVAAQTYWDGVQLNYVNTSFGDGTSKEFAVDSTGVSISEYLRHIGDTGTRVRLRSGQITLDAASVTFLDIQNTTQDIVQFNPGTLDIDFVVNANGILGALFVEGSTGAVSLDTSLQVNSTVTIDQILDEDDMASDSDTALATQQSIKKYVDNQIATIDTWDVVIHNGESTTIADTENLSVTINQNDVTNNPAALTITNTGSGNDITLPNSTSIKNGSMILGDNLSVGGNIELSGTILKGTGSSLNINMGTSDSSDTAVLYLGGGGGTGATRGAFVHMYGNEAAVNDGLLYLGAGNDANGYIRFDEGGGEKMRIHTNGYLGVNVTDPDTRVEILDGSGTQLKLSQTDGVDATIGVDATGQLNISQSTSFYGISLHGANIGNNEALGVKSKATGIAFLVEESGSTNKLFSVVDYPGGNRAQINLYASGVDVITIDSGDTSVINTDWEWQDDKIVYFGNDGDAQIEFDSVANELIIQGNDPDADNISTSLHLKIAGTNPQSGYIILESADANTSSIAGIKFLNKDYDGNSYDHGGGTDKFLTIDGSGYVIVGNDVTTISPAGSDTHIQYNDSGAFGATSDFAFDGNGMLKLYGATSATNRVLGLKARAVDTYTFFIESSATTNRMFSVYADGTAGDAQVIMYNNNDWQLKIEDAGGNTTFRSDSNGALRITSSGAETILYGTDNYLNFGTTLGSAGYGIRDNSGTMEYKNSSGDWTAFNADGQIYLSAAGMWPSTTNGCADATKVEFGTNDIDVYVMDFDQSSDEYAQISIAMPTDWDGSTITAQFYWTSGTTGAVVWGIQGQSYGDGVAIDSSWGTAQTVTDSNAATDRVQISSVTSAVTISGAGAGELVQFRIYRDADNGSDTLAADARLVGVLITYGRS